MRATPRKKLELDRLDGGGLASEDRDIHAYMEYVSSKTLKRCMTAWRIYVGITTGLG